MLLAEHAFSLGFVRGLERLRGFWMGAPKSVAQDEAGVSGRSLWDARLNSET